jgi:preprotein translocase SecE subunit
MADKKKNTSQSPARNQNQMVSPKPKARSNSDEKDQMVTPVAPKARSDEKEQPKTAKAVAPARERNERKVQESSKSTRRDAKSSAPWQVRFRNNRTIRFIFDAYYELRHKVTWPSFNEARNMTIAVILISLAVGFVLWVVDVGLVQLYFLISR